MDDLNERVMTFKMMKLPGQPQMMHIGTLELVADLAHEVAKLGLALALCRENNETLTSALAGAQDAARLQRREAKLAGEI